MLDVTLTPEEMFAGATVGVRRRIRAILKRRQHRHGYEGGDNWTTDVDAALAEMAVAKALDRFWTDDPAPDYEGDVGSAHVRATPRKDGCLILHKDDPDEAMFVLVVGRENTWGIVGWIQGRDGKQEEFWREDTGRPAFFVPQNALHPPPKEER